MTSKEQAGFETPIAWIVEPEVCRSLLGKRKIRVPQARGTSRVFWLEQDIDGTHRLKPVTANTVEYQQTAESQFSFVIVNTTSHEMELEFCAVAKDRAGHPFDLILQCSCCVRQLEQFISEVVLKQASPDRPMTIQRAKVWMENAIRTRLQEQVTEQLVRYSFEELRDREVLQSSWWEKKVESWLSGSGIAINVGTARWENPHADRAEKERVSQREMELDLALSQKTNELELAVAKSEAVHQAEIEAIRARVEMAKGEHQHEEELARVRREIELEKMRGELRELKTNREAESLAAEAERARINQQEEQARQLEQMKQELLDRNQRDLERAKVQLADQLTAQLKANPGMLERLTEDARGEAVEDAAERPDASRKPPDAPEQSPGKRQKVSPPSEAKLGKKEKIKAMAEARAKVRTTDAQDMMKQLSDVYNNAAAAKLAENASGDSTGSSFDYKHISDLFGGAVGSEKKVDTPKRRGKPKVKVEATPEKAGDDSASDGLADRLQQMFGSSPGQARKIKTDRSTDKPSPALGKPEPVGRKRTSRKAKADKSADSVDKKATEALHERFAGLYGSGGSSDNRPSGASPGVDDKPPHATAEDVARVGVSSNSTPSKGDDQDGSTTKDGDHTGKRYDAAHFSRMLRLGESKKKTPKVHSSDKGDTVFHPESFLKKGGQSSQESQDDSDSPEARDESGDREDTKSSFGVFAVGKQSVDQSPEKAPKAKKTAKNTKKSSITPKNEKKNAKQGK